MSQIEIDLMLQFHKAHDEGELLERPRTDIMINLGPTSWYHNVYTTPDFTFEKSHILIYLDGRPHKSRTRSRRDQEIKNILETMNWTVKRYRYLRNTKKKRMEIFKEVTAAVNRRIAGG